MKAHKLANLLPPMTDQEYESLKQDIKANGLNEDIWTYQGTILDGRHRYRACHETGIKPRFKEYQGDTPASFVLGQNKRRNLTPSQWAMVAGRMTPLIEKEEGRPAQIAAGAHGPKGGRKPTQKPLWPIGHKGNGRAPCSRDKAAAATGASPRQTQRAIAIDAVDPALGDAVLAGKVNIHQAEREVKRRQKAAELEAKAKSAKRKGHRADSKIVCGDCLEQLPKVGAPRLIFADPPYNIGIDYGKGSQADKVPADLFLSWCGQWIGACRDAMTADGSLWVMINDDWADHVALLLRAAGFHRRAWIKWYETFGVNCQDNFNRTSRHIFYCVKDRRRFAFFPEAVTRPSDRQSKYADKRANPAGKIWDDVWQIPRLTGNHPERMPFFPTQVPLAILRAIVGCASAPGDLVVDPFSGSGTTGVACRQLGRRFIGIELNAEYVKRARARIAATDTDKGVT